MSRHRLSAGSSRAAALASRVNLPLVAIVALGTLFSAYFTRQVTEWGLMTDELQHVKLAVSFADTLDPRPVVRGTGLGAYSQLYPILIAPLVGLFDMPTAFRAIHLFNSLLMASAAIPAYLLARQVVRWSPAALLVAALTVAVPWIGMSTLVMTEVAAYPAFVWAVLAIHRALVEPSPRRDLIALVAVVLAFVARTQFVVLAIALPLLIVLHEVGFAFGSPSEEPRGRRLRAALARAVRGHVVVAAATALGLLVAAWLVARDRFSILLGSYGGAARGEIIPAGTGDYAAQLVAIVGVGVGIVPVVLAAAWAAATLVRPADRHGHAFALELVVIGGLLLVEVSSFLIRFSGSVQDRYVFYLVPLALIAMAACLLEARRHWPLVLASGAAFAWLTTFVLFEPGQRSYFASPPSLFHTVIAGRLKQIGFDDPGTPMVLAVLALTALLAALLARRSLRRRPLLLAVGAVLLVFCVAETAYTTKQMTSAVDEGDLRGRDWVDARLPDGAHAAMLPGRVNAGGDGTPLFIDNWVNTANWWGVEFWNKSITRSLAYDGEQYAGATPFDLKELTVDQRTGEVETELDTPYLVMAQSNTRFRPRGESIHVDWTGLELMRAELPLALDWVTLDLPEDGWIPRGQPVTVRLFGEPGETGRERTVRIQLDSIPTIRVDRPVRIEAGGRVFRDVVRANTFKTVEANVCVPPDGSADLDIRVLPGPPFPGDSEAPGGLRVSKIDAGEPGRPCSAGTLSRG